jgi:Fe-S-cluster formation regulator IscX/YfhJ
MNLYEVFAEAATTDPTKSFRDLWFDFVAWERLRGYRDDPSAISKEVLDWVQGLDELIVRLEDFDGPGKESCQHALDAALVAFTRLEHPDELSAAVRKWRESRQAEKAETTEPLSIGTLSKENDPPSR